MCTDCSGAKTLCQDIASFLDERKATNVVVIPLPATALADYLVIASGNVARHVQSLAEATRAMVKAKHNIVSSIEGYHTGDWVLIDAGSVIVHMFRPEVRIYYDLEGMWDDVAKAPTSDQAQLGGFEVAQIS